MPITIYGAAAGHGTTQDAARGALCIRQYDTQDLDDIPQCDWLAVYIAKTTPATPALKKDEKR